MNERFFTPKEANQNLPLVKQIVGAILSKAKEARALMAAPGSQERLNVLEGDIKVLISRLEGMGCYYKDWNFEIGLVDFPAIIHGQEALLCWRSDEESVAWFHGFQDGYAGRRPISKDLIFS